MRRAWIAAAVSLVLSCSPGRTVHDPGAGITEGTDPSRDRYLLETFLDRPLSGPFLEAGTGCDLDRTGRTVSKEAWARIRTGGIKGAARVRVRDGVVREAFHLSAAPADIMKIDLGDLVPDLGIGLLSSGRRFAYPFSSGHPLYRPAGIKGWTGFYGSFIRGCAVRVSSGQAALTLVAGRPASHGTEGVEYLQGRDVSGIRVNAGTGAVRAGLTTVDGGSRSGGRITGLDLTLISGGRRCMVEAAVVPSGSVSAVWGLSANEKDIYCGLIGWSVPAGADGYLASFPGLSAASARARSGASVTLRRRFPGRIHISAWGELRRSSDGGRRYLDRAFRFETGIRWKRGAARCSWSSRMRESEVFVPFPPRRDVDTGLSGGLSMSLSHRLSRILSFVLDVKRPGGDGGEGTLGAVRAEIAIRRFYSRLKVSAASYRSVRGRAGFSLYEPSGGGKYPWKTVYGSGSRLSLGLQTERGPVKGSLWLLWTGEGDREAAIYLSVSI